MKTFQLPLTAMLLLGLTTVAFAQRTREEDERRSDFMLQVQENRLKASYRATLSGSGLNGTIPWFENAESIREQLNISEEQIQTIQDIRINQRRTIVQDDPEYKAIKNAIDEVYSDIHNDTEEAQQHFFYLIRKQRQIEEEKLEAAINTLLTSEQIQNIKEFQISVLSDDSFVTPNMFEALDLSDEQRKQLDAIKQEMIPEIEKYIDQQAELGMFDVRLDAEFRKILNTATSLEENKKYWDELWPAMKKEAAPKHQQKQDEFEASIKKLTHTLKIKMFDVLTDEQWNRVVQLIDNPPELIKRIRVAKAAKEKKEVWAPGPNSWRPGDPIPEGYRQQRQERGRFPRVNQSE